MNHGCDGWPSHGSAGRTKPGGARMTNEPLGGTVSEGVSSMLTTPAVTAIKFRILVYRDRFRRILKDLDGFTSILDGDDFGINFRNFNP